MFSSSHFVYGKGRSQSRRLRQCAKLAMPPPEMTLETDLLPHLRAIATSPEARGLADDTALLGDLVLTHDMIVEGVHFLPDDAPADIAWKLVAVNLSDLAAKGAAPLGVLTGMGLRDDPDWNAAFVEGLGAALFAMGGGALLGGDTVAMPAGAPRAFGLTAIGRATGRVPDRAGGRAGDRLYVVGTIGDAGLGLAIAQGHMDGPAELLAAYRRPVPHVAAGRLLAPQVSAMMDVSDGLLIDAARLAEASGCGVEIDLDALPLSDAGAAFGTDRAARLRAATAGDDYALLFAAKAPVVGLPIACVDVGRLTDAPGLVVLDHDGQVPIPTRLGWLHQG
jgi:thiamine-monophosphate kinase